MSWYWWRHDTGDIIPQNQKLMKMTENVETSSTSVHFDQY